MHVMYTRTSDRHQPQESRKQQQRQLVAAAEQLGRAADSFEQIDEDTHGVKPYRPGIGHLHDLIERGEVDVLVVADLTRLGRDGIVDQKLIDSILAHGGRVVLAYGEFGAVTNGTTVTARKTGF